MTEVYFTWAEGHADLASCEARVEVLTAASRKRLFRDNMTFGA